MCPIPNGFQDRCFTVWEFGFGAQYGPSLPPCCATVWSMWIGVKRRLAVVTVDNDIVVLLCKMQHIFTDTEYADMPYIYGLCDGSATANVDGIFENVLC
jgi:hypothetical protein